MCGIAGIVNFKSAPDFQALECMLAIITHRGPDGAGSFIEGPLALGHCRLAIIDRSEAGTQPMEYLNRYVITYNGEIYNYLELRQELREKGYQFKSGTDTEVILAAYDFWGEECLHHFNGMFAFALYDREKQTLFLARDRFGVKPLYYFIGPDGAFYFASEIKQFTVIAGWSASLNRQRAYDYLNWGITDHTTQTMFAAVFQLRGGESLRLDLQAAVLPIDNMGQLPQETWYELKDSLIADDDCVRQFRNLFEDSVRLRLRADVPVGSCLSGGLDSSSIVCMTNKILTEQGNSANQKTFSACTTVKELDEKEYMDEVVQKTLVDFHYVYPQCSDLLDHLEDLVWHQDEPFGSTSIYAQWSVFQLAKQQGVTVMLDGQGADEQLAGYHGFFSQRYSSLFRQRKFITLFREFNAAQRNHGHSFYRSFQYLFNAILPERIKNYARKWLGKDSLVAIWLDLSRLGVVASVPLPSEKLDSIADFSKAQLTATHLPMLLHWEDRNSMAHSIEARVPFLDYRLVEFIYSLPDERKLSQGVTKRILREAMQQVLPEKIRMRMDKKGFLTPELLWFKQHPDLFNKQLDNAIHLSKGIIKPSAAKQLFNAVVSGKQRDTYAVWRMICFGVWIRKFNVKI